MITQNATYRSKTAKSDKLFSWLIGIGLVLFAVHNPDQPLLQYAFLPVLGFLLILYSVLFTLYDHRREIKWGSKWVYIPLLVISISISISGILNYNLWQATACALSGAMFLGLYLVARILRQQLFKPFAFAVIIEAISLVIYGFVNQGDKTGGIISWTNYDMATGLLVFGLVVSALKYQWWLAAVALVGLYFTGADEAVFCVVVLGGYALLVRRDISKKLLLPIGALAVILAICTPMGITQSLYYPTVQKLASAKEAVQDTPVGRLADKIIPESIQAAVLPKLSEAAPYKAGEVDESELLDIASGNRFTKAWHLSSLKPFGYGFNMTEFYEGIPHNVFLIITEQVGIVAAVAWLFLIVYLLIKTKWKYAMVALLAMGVFDHFVWSQVAPWWWALVGMASVPVKGKDLIFAQDGYEVVMARARHIAEVAKLA